ncbi:DUF3352 domain-containing protein [Oerskovia sp. KBS0722]|uniref:DUF3352 domain-containing protein n=1 Tax=Oerskovia sp. KBS0722 TaxID=1179673 RepID=UPI00143CF829|nr:DUF3352 domain-containing protein [Oerskovia sp. KBS0722]
MTTPPTFPPADPSGAWQQPAGGATPASAPVTTVKPSRLRTGLVLGGAATAALVLVGGGVFAYGALDGGGAQPEAALPDTAFAYVRVDLDPSATQKVNLLRLANRFPDLAADLDVDLRDDADLRKLVVDAIAKSGTCEIDYATDVEPWIGRRAAIAVLPPVEGATTRDAGDAPEPEPVVALQVTDEGAARAAIESGLGCGDGAKPAQVAFTDGYALITSEKVVAADVAAAAKKAPLADAPQFAADMKALGDPGLISYWADVEGAITALEGQKGAEELDAAVTQGLRSVAGAARAGADHLELAIAVGADEKVLAPMEGAGTSLLTGLPESTLFASSATVDPASVDQLWEQLSTLADAYGSSGLGGLGSGEDLLGDDWTLSSHEVRTAGTLATATEAECAALLALPENALDASDWGLTPEELVEVTRSYDESFMAGCTGDYSAIDEGLDTYEGTEEADLFGDDRSTGSATDDLLPSGLGFQETVDELEKTYDLRLPEDLKTLLGEQVVVALDSAGLDDVSSVTGLADVDLGARTIGDKAALEDLLGRIDAILVDAGAEKLTSATTKDGLVVASNEAYAARLAQDGKLGTVDAFRTVVPDAKGAANAAYLDVDALESIARANIDATGGDDSWIAYVEPLRAVGVSSRVVGDHSLTSLRVSFD